MFTLTMDVSTFTGSSTWADAATAAKRQINTARDLRKRAIGKL
jgi:hypothetical protein